MGRAGDGRNQKPLWQGVEPEAPIKAVGGFGQIACAVFLKRKGMISAGQACLEMTPYRIDPVELGQIFRLFPADNSGLVLTSRMGNRTEAVEAIRNHRAARV